MNYLPTFEAVLDKFVLMDVRDEVVTVLQVGKHSCMMGPIYSGPTMVEDAKRHKESIKDMLRQIYNDLKNSKEEFEERKLDSLHGGN